MCVSSSNVEMAEKVGISLARVLKADQKSSKFKPSLLTCTTKNLWEALVYTNRPHLWRFCHYGFTYYFIPLSPKLIFEDIYS